MYTKNKKNEFSWNKRPSKMVYDPLMYVLSKYAYNERIKAYLIEKKQIIKEKMEEIFVLCEIDFNGRNNNKSDVIRRITLFENLFKAIIEVD